MAAAIAAAALPPERGARFAGRAGAGRALRLERGRPADAGPVDRRRRRALGAGYRTPRRPGLGAAGEQNSWLFGVRRMLLGYASGGDAAFAGIEAYGEVGGLDAA